MHTTTVRRPFRTAPRRSFVVAVACALLLGACAGSEEDAMPDDDVAATAESSAVAAGPSVADEATDAPAAETDVPSEPAEAEPADEDDVAAPNVGGDGSSLSILFRGETFQASTADESFACTTGDGTFGVQLTADGWDVDIRYEGSGQGSVTATLPDGSNWNEADASSVIGFLAGGGNANVQTQLVNTETGDVEAFNAGLVCLAR